MTPATAGPGNQAGPAGLRLAAVASTVVGDADWRWYYGDGVHGWGLRDGTFSLSGLRWPEDPRRPSGPVIGWTCYRSGIGSAIGRESAGTRVMGNGR